MISVDTVCKRRMILSIAALSLLLGTSALVAEDKASDPWKTFDLATTKVGPVTLRYDKAMTPKLPAIRKALSDYLKQEAEMSAQVELLRTKSGQIIARVNKITGYSPVEKEIASQREILSSFLKMRFRLARDGHKMTVILVNQKATKDYLRKGGKLPCFSYDKTKDMVDYRFKMEWKSEDKNQRRVGSIVIPLPSDGPAERLSDVLRGLRLQQSMMGGGGCA